MNEYTPAPEATTPESNELYLTNLRNAYQNAKDDVDRLKNQIEFIGAHLESWKAKWDRAQQYLQASIDREEWEQSELAEPFWEEMAEMFDLNLKRTKEIEIRVTITYSGTVTVPHDCDAESDLDIEGLSNELTVNYGGQEIEDQWVTFEGQEIEEY